MLVKAYHVAVQNSLNVPILYPQELQSLQNALVFAQKDIYFVNYYLNILSDTLIDFDNYQGEDKVIFFRNELKKTLYSFPAKNKVQKNLINIDFDFDEIGIYFDMKLLNTVLFIIIQYATKLIGNYSTTGSLRVLTKQYKKHNIVNFDVIFNGNKHRGVKNFKKGIWFDYCRTIFKKYGKFDIASIDNGIRFSLVFINVKKEGF